MKKHLWLMAGLAVAMIAVAQPSLARETKAAPGPAVGDSNLDNAAKPGKAKKADATPASRKIKIRPLKKLKDMTDK
jgi:hypothetical protein